MDKKKTSKFVIALFGAMILLSAALAWIMGQNYSKDVNKERKALSEDLKKIQKEDFVYSPEKAVDVYAQFCLRCHGAEGQGTAAAPPLAGSELVAGEKSKTIKVAVHGMKGKIERKGKTYNLTMPAFPMIPHRDMAHVLTYIRKSFGNDASEVTPVDVLKIKIDHVERAGPWTQQEL